MRKLFKKSQNRRKSNLVIFSAEEQKQELSQETKIENDKKNHRRNVTVTEYWFNLDTIKPTRLGKYMDNKSRPIKITLKDEQEVRSVIRIADQIAVIIKYRQHLTIPLDSKHTTRRSKRN